MADVFSGARLKIERADHHINDLQTQFAAFVDTNPYTLAVGSNPETGQPSVLIKFRKNVPAEWALIIGDAIHNLRTALDHMTWALIGKVGGKQDRYLKFPTGDNRINFEATCKGIQTPSQAAIDAFIALEAFSEGKGNSLYALHQLDNAEKHAILMPVIRAATINKLTIFNAKDEPMVTFENCTFIGGSGAYATVANVGRGCNVELDRNAKATPDIFFGKIAEGQVGNLPILGALSNLRSKVSETVESFAAQFG